MKHSTFTGVLAWSGGTMVLKADQRFSDDHPLVKERPDLFEDGDTDAGVVSTPKNAQMPPMVESTMQTGPGGGRFQKKSTGQ